MKNLAIILMFLTVALFSFSGCKKTKELTCDLNTVSTQPPVEMNIVYSATQTGDGAIASLTYTTITGPVTIQNPSLPWSLTVSVLTTTNVSISATGTTKNGSLEISYAGTSGGSTISGSDFCQQQSN